MATPLKLLNKLGPGILFAGAAIGASHLVQSTRAGASYGFSLLIVVLLANLFKYPFFEYGQRYTAATGESIIAGYARRSKALAFLFLILNLLTSVISAAGVTIVSAAIIKFILGAFWDIGTSVEIALYSLAVVALVASLLFTGSYSFLDKAVKYMIIALSVFTLFAFISSVFGLAANTTNNSLVESFIPFSGEISTGFLIALIGWMPAPVEASSWSSLWAIEKAKSDGETVPMAQTLFDFKVGYITTTILACLFLGLGAMVLFASGGEVASSGAVAFVQQLITLYTSNLGAWALPVISIVALATMFSTTLTVVDAYPRAIEESLKVLKIGSIASIFSYRMLVIIISLSAIGLIYLYGNKMTELIDFVTTVSFLAAPIFGTLNVIVMESKYIENRYRPPLITRAISYAGIAFALILAFWYFMPNK